MTPDDPKDPKTDEVDETAVSDEALDEKAPEAEAAEEPAADEPTADEPAAEEPTAEAADDEPEAEAETADEPSAEAETADEPSAEAETADEPSAEADEESEPEPVEDEPAEDELQAEAAAKPKRRRRGRKAAEEEEPEEAPAPSRNGRRDVEPAVLVRAQARYVRTSARKARLVCDHIRGKDVAEARAILAFTPRAAAKAWTKLLESAVANAEHNHELVGEELRIHSVHADEGPTLKRYRPRAMGRATRIRKRTSHLTITLTPKES
jgi:ribosomal protein L22